MYLFIQISGKCAFGSQAQEAELQGAKGVILFDPEGSIIDSPYPRVNGNIIANYYHSINIFLLPDIKLIINILS